MKLGKTATGLLLLFLLAACAKPDEITTIRSSVNGLYLTIETFHGHGPASSDDTTVYVRLSGDGRSDKQLALSGEYLSFAEAAWTAPDIVTLCLASGITAEFRNEVTVRVGDRYEKVHVVLKENCNKI
jgi:hypothetical protein